MSSLDCFEEDEDFDRWVYFLISFVGVGATRAGATITAGGAATISLLGLAISYF